MNLRFGIIGYGFMGHEHMTLLSDFDGIDVIAICDREADQMNDAPEGVAKYTDAADLLARDDIDVVIISANNNQHLKQQPQRKTLSVRNRSHCPFRIWKRWRKPLQRMV